MTTKCPECGFLNEKEDIECLVCGQNLRIECQSTENNHEIEHTLQAENILQNEEEELEEVESSTEYECPKCNFQNEINSSECLRCGVIFSKYNNSTNDERAYEGENNLHEHAPSLEKKLKSSALFLSPIAILTEHKKPVILFVGLLTIVLAIIIFWPQPSLKILSPKLFDVYYDIPYPPGYPGIPVQFEAKLSTYGRSSDGEFEWKSDLDGYLGKGKKISADLSIGEHNIFVKYSDGKEAKMDTTIITVLKTPRELFIREEVQKPDRIREVKDQDGRVLIADYDNDVILDTSTGLMWMRRPVPYTFTYHDAIKYAKMSTFAGFDNWRLPTFSELVDISNIYHDGRSATLNQVFTCRHGKFWSSSIREADEYSETCAYTIHYSPRILRGYRYFGKKTIATLGSKIWIRLVRNDF